MTRTERCPPDAVWRAIKPARWTRPSIADGRVRPGYTAIFAALDTVGIDGLRAATTDLDRRPGGRGHLLHRRDRRGTAGAALPARSRFPACCRPADWAAIRAGLAAADPGAQRLPGRRLRRDARSSGTASSPNPSSGTVPGSCLPPPISPRAAGRGPPCSGSTCCTRPSGEWVVLEDNLRVPSGLGYAVANRRTAAARCPMLHPWPGLRSPEIGGCGPARRVAAGGAAAVSARGPAGGCALRRRRRIRPGTSTGCWPTRWASRSSPRRTCPGTRTASVAAVDGADRPLDVLYRRLGDDEMVAGQPCPSRANALLLAAASGPARCPW